MMAAAVTVAAMTLGELLGPAAAEHAGLAVTDLVLDSRQATRGAAFIAVPGETTHGLAFAADALARGAAVIVYEPSREFPDVPGTSLAVTDLRARLGTLAKRFFGRASKADELIGITGTNGKTTVAYLVAQSLSMLGRPCGYIGTLGFGQPPALTAHALTTPDCFTLHREIVSLGTEAVALEVSSHALAQDRVAGLEITTSVVTNLSRDHLDAHGSMDAYGRAKARIVQLEGLESAVLNLDDVFAAGLRAQIAEAVHVIGVTRAGASGAALRARADFVGLDGLTLSVEGPHGAARLDSALIGDFNAENLLLALGALVATGVDLDAACYALGRCAAPPGRMEVFGGGSDPFVIVDYAHTPAALERVLRTVRPMASGSVICVFGCGGERDRGKRPLMGAVAGIADRIVLTDDNPRGEDPRAIVADIRRGIDAQREVEVEHDRSAAIEQAVRSARAGDVVVVAGKGHEATQAVRGELRALDDRAVVTEALGGRS